MEKMIRELSESEILEKYKSSVIDYQKRAKAEGIATRMLEECGYTNKRIDASITYLEKCTNLRKLALSMNLNLPDDFFQDVEISLIDIKRVILSVEADDMNWVCSHRYLFSKDEYNLKLKQMSDFFDNVITYAENNFNSFYDNVKSASSKNIAFD